MRGSKLLFVGFCVLSIWMLIFQVVHAADDGGLHGYLHTWGNRGEWRKTRCRGCWNCQGGDRRRYPEQKGRELLDEALQLLPGVHIRTGADGVPGLIYGDFDRDT